MTLNNNRIKQEIINYAQIFYSLKIFNIKNINKKINFITTNFIKLK